VNVGANASVAEAFIGEPHVRSLPLTRSRMGRSTWAIFTGGRLDYTGLSPGGGLILDMHPPKGTSKAEVTGVLCGGRDAPASVLPSFGFDDRES